MPKNKASCTLNTSRMDCAEEVSIPWARRPAAKPDRTELRVIPKIDYTHSVINIRRRNKAASSLAHLLRSGSASSPRVLVALTTDGMTDAPLG